MASAVTTAPASPRRSGRTPSWSGASLENGYLCDFGGKVLPLSKGVAEPLAAVLARDAEVGVIVAETTAAMADESEQPMSYTAADGFDAIAAVHARTTQGQEAP